MPEVGGKKTGQARKKVLSGSGIPVFTTGNERPRTENDFYPTDIKTVLASLMWYNFPIPKDVPFIVVDPGPGTGNWGKGFRKLYPKSEYPNVHLIGIELDKKFKKPSCYDEWHNENFITGYWVKSQIQQTKNDYRKGVDLIIGNPPFEIDTEFVAQALQIINPHHGTISFLFRLGFLAAEERALTFYLNGFAQSHVLVYNTRPSFLPETQDHTTDEAEPQTTSFLDVAAPSAKGATYPGDFAQFTWHMRGGNCTEERRFDHLVYRECKTCGAVFFPRQQHERTCEAHTLIRVPPQKINLEQYVRKGYGAFLEREARKANREAAELRTSLESNNQESSDLRNALDRAANWQQLLEEHKNQGNQK